MKHAAATSHFLARQVLHIYCRQFSNRKPREPRKRRNPVGVFGVFCGCPILNPPADAVTPISLATALQRFRTCATAVVMHVQTAAQPRSAGLDGGPGLELDLAPVAA